MMRLAVRPKLSKRAFLYLLVAIVVAGGGYILYATLVSAKNPLPAEIKRQVSFKVVYPSSQTAQIDKTSYEYQANQGVLSFIAQFGSTQVLFSEQLAPSSLGAGTQIYYPALGIHPYAQFQTKLGPVALTRFWQSGTLEPLGESGIMVAHKTMLIAHAGKSLTDQQWKTLFTGLRITE